MSRIDIIILIIAGLGAIQGFMKGFVLSITSLLGLILGYYLSVRFGWIIEGYLAGESGVSNPLYHVLAFVLAFLLVVIIMYFIGKSIETLLEMASLGCVNRIAGALFGIFKGLLLVAALIYVLELADVKSAIVTKAHKEASIFWKPIAELVIKK